MSEVRKQKTEIRIKCLLCTDDYKLTMKDMKNMKKKGEELLCA